MPHAENLPAAEGAGGIDGGGSTIDARVSVLLPQDLLDPSETIILLIKPSPWFIVLESLRSLAVLAVMVLAVLAALPMVGDIINRRDLILAGVGLAGLRLFWQFLEWLSRVYILTDRRVIVVMGIFRVLVSDATLQQVRDCEVLQSMRERVMGLGTLMFTTTREDLPQMYWKSVALPEDVQEVVQKTLQRYR